MLTGQDGRFNPVLTRGAASSKLLVRLPGRAFSDHIAIVLRISYNLIDNAWVRSTLAESVESHPENTDPCDKAACPRGRLHMNPATISAAGNEVTTWHAMAAEDVLRRLNTDTKKGLDPAEISQRLAKYGPNRLPEGAKRGPF